MRFQTGASSEHSQHRNLPQVLLSLVLPESLQLGFKDKIHTTSLGLADAELLQNTLKTQSSVEEYSELQRQRGMRQEEEEAG